MPLELTIGQAFLPLFYNTDPFVLIESPRGCLKTCTILHVMMSRAAKWPGKRWYIWRSTRALLSTTVLPSFEEYVLPVWNRVRGMRLMNPAARPTQRSEYVFENGSVFLPIGLDDILRGTSAEGAGGYLAEAVELDNENQALALSGMMRQPGVPFHQIILDVNPGPPGHWTNQIAEPVANKLRRVSTREDYDRLQQHNRTPAKDPASQWKRIVAKIQDNPYYFDVDNWKLREPGAAYLNTLSVRGHLRRRWVDGEWVAAEGAVYPEFDDSKHVIDPFEIPKSWPCTLANDPGRDHPDATVIGATAPNGRLYLCAESVVRQTTRAQDAAVLTRLSAVFNIVRKLGDPHYMFSSTKHSDTGRTIAQQFLDYGHRFERAPLARNQAEIAQQVEMVRTLMVTLGADGLPMLQVFRSLPNTIRGFQTWGYDRDSKGQMKAGPDKFEDVADDEMDCVRMIVASRPRFEPQAIRSMSKPAVDEGPVVLPNGRKRWYGDEDE